MNALPRLLLLSLAAMLAAGSLAAAEPTADQVLTDLGFSNSERQRVLDGEYVRVNVRAVSERDVTFATAFLCRASADEVARQIMADALFDADREVQAHGELDATATPADLAALPITHEEAESLSRARPGDDVNFSAAEFAALKGERARSAEATQESLRQVLLARLSAYRRAGLAGIDVYDRGGGRHADVASDLRMASESLSVLKKYMPAFHALLLAYPDTTIPDVQQRFVWLKSNVRGHPTYVLTHVLMAGNGAARAVVRREFYVSTGYNAEQSVAGFLPVAGGTVVVYTSHAFTDQVAGAGGSLKRSIGSRILADKMKEIFDVGRRRIEPDKR